MIVFEAKGKPFKGNLHLHTTHSDGAKTPLEAVQAYESAGYDFLAITDHRKVTILDGYQGRMLLLPGIELDRELPGGEVVHLLGIGMDQPLSYQAAGTAQGDVEAIRAAGGLCYLAHPHWSMNQVETVLALSGIAGAEIYNAVSVPPYNADRADSTHLLDLLAQKGSMLPTLANDDSHYYGLEFARGFNLVYANSLTKDDVLLALKNGQFYASQGPQFRFVSIQGDQVVVECDPVSRILFHSNLAWNDKRCTAGEGITKGTYRIARERGEMFIRVILIDGKGRRAWLNPFLT